MSEDLPGEDLLPPFALVYMLVFVPVSHSNRGRVIAGAARGVGASGLLLEKGMYTNGPATRSTSIDPKSVYDLRMSNTN